MNKATDCYKLSNGVEIPCLGFGTWQTPDGEVAENSVKCAIQSGYRHIDTAAVYGNEVGVGKGIHESGVPREELFITTKVWNTDHGYDATMRAFDESMKRLGLDYIDLYLIHWPKLSPLDLEWKRKISETWRAMEILRKDGYVRSIGVSNFLPHHLEPLLRDCEVIPALDQLELHAGYMQQYAMTFCEANKIHLQAWSPLGRGRLNDNSFIKDLADKYQVTPQKLMLRFLNQLDISVIPKSNSLINMSSNLDIFDFTINREDLSILMSLPQFGFSGEFPDTADFT